MIYRDRGVVGNSFHRPGGYQNLMDRVLKMIMASVKETFQTHDLLSGFPIHIEVAEQFDGAEAFRMLCQSLLQGFPVERTEKLVGVQREDDIVRGMTDTEISGGGEIVYPRKFIDMLCIPPCNFQRVIG